MGELDAPSGAIELARGIVEATVWCTVATAHPETAEPRARVMHPVWFWHDDRPFALVTARRTPVKVAHLVRGASVACCYWDQHHHTATIDATARWLEPQDLADAWAAIADVPGPVGFDPAMIWPDGPASDGVAMLRFDAHRVVASRAGAPPSRWRANS